MKAMKGLRRSRRLDAKKKGVDLVGDKSQRQKSKGPKGRPMTIWWNRHDSSQPPPSRVDGVPKSDADSREQRRLDRTSFYEEVITQER